VAFKVLFLAHAPDAEKEKHKNLIDTGMYQLHSAVVKNQAEALEVSKGYVTSHQIDCILLCPGFTNLDVAEISENVGHNIAVGVCRSDGPGNRITQYARMREGYQSKKE
jgi:stage V sporulation protein SpoVS